LQTIRRTIENSLRGLNNKKGTIEEDIIGKSTIEQ